MKPGSGKAKGSSFERLIATQLSLWVTNGQKRDIFWRSSLSGGRSTVAGRKGHNLSRQAGDICAIAPEGHALMDRCYLELKHIRNLRFDKFVFATGPLQLIWKKTIKEARKYQRQPILIINTARLPIMLITRDTNTFGIPDIMLPHVIIYEWNKLISRAYEEGWKTNARAASVRHPS
jgi:hypothetical protein